MGVVPGEMRSSKGGLAGGRPGVVTYRPVRPEDADLLARLARARWSSLPLPELVELQDRAQRREYSARLGDAGEHAILEDGVPIGRVWWSDDQADRWIVDLALLPDARGRGIASAVVASIVEGAGQRSTRCSVEHSNRRWRSQLEAIGFVEVRADELRAELVRSPDPHA